MKPPSEKSPIILNRKGGRRPFPSLGDEVERKRNLGCTDSLIFFFVHKRGQEGGGRDNSVRGGAENDGILRYSTKGEENSLHYHHNTMRKEKPGRRTPFIHPKNGEKEGKREGFLPYLSGRP